MRRSPVRIRSGPPNLNYVTRPRKMKEKKRRKFCHDCGKPSSYHIHNWIEELVCLLPFQFLYFFARKAENWLPVLLEKLSIFLRLASLEDNFDISKVGIRTACFIEEARKNGMKFKIFRGPFGYTNHFSMQIKGKEIRFDGLPIAEFLSKYDVQNVDDKKLVKKYFKKGNFPLVEGKSIWFFQKKKAFRYGLNQLGFPLVVKPQCGSFARHITLDIKNEKQFKQAVNKVLKYSPNFIVEKFIPDSFVHRATVIDFDFIACAKRLQANIIGDGEHSINQLINKKNNHPYRGVAKGDEAPLCKIVVDKTTKKLIEEKNYDFSTIPDKGEIVWLQKDPFVRLGADVIEVTEKVHPDNFKLFQDIAKFFDVRVVGIDFMAQDISRSWKNQPCAVLELNSLPCIEIHHFPSSGKPQNVAKALLDMVLKYYL